MSFKNEFLQFKESHRQVVYKIDNTTFKYTLGGKGEYTFLLLVGGLGVSDAFFKHFLALEKYGKVLTFDYPIEINNNAKLADNIVELIRELKLDNIILIGQSYGGIIAQIIAKRYPNVVKGMVLSNTATYNEKMHSEALKELQDTIKNIKRTSKLLRVLPENLLKVILLKSVKKKFNDLDPKEKAYLIEMFQELFKEINKAAVIHMDTLLIDSINYPINKMDLNYLDGKVLLIISEDDNTFSEEIKYALVNVMTNPRICRNINGGHLALFGDIHSYISEIIDFIKSI